LPGTPVTVFLLSGPDELTVLKEELRYCPEGSDLNTFALNQALPPGVTAEDFTLDGTIATVTLSENAAPLEKFSLTAVRACIVLTLTALDGIDGVIILIEGQVSEPAVLRASDFIHGSLVLADIEWPYTLYFADQGTGRPAAETRTRTVRETDTVDWYLRYILEDLIKGPQTEGLLPILPEGTELLSVLISEGSICTVNFSGDFLSNADDTGITPELTLRCLIRSVTAQPGITALRLQVDGQPLERYGSFDTSRALTAADAG
jgi:germination protein M